MSSDGLALLAQRLQALSEDGVKINPGEQAHQGERVVLGRRRLRQVFSFAQPSAKPLHRPYCACKWFAVRCTNCAGLSTLGSAWFVEPLHFSNSDSTPAALLARLYLSTHQRGGQRAPTFGLRLQAALLRRRRPWSLRMARRSPAAAARSPPPPAATANPAPLGLYGFALTTALLQGAKTQLTEPTGTTQLAVSFGFFFGGLAQFCAGLLEYQRRNTFGTVAFCWWVLASLAWAECVWCSEGVKHALAGRAARQPAPQIPTCCARPPCLPPPPPSPAQLRRLLDVPGHLRHPVCCGRV